MQLISRWGRAPAYLLLRFVAFWYVVADKKTREAVQGFYGRLGLHSGFKRIYEHICSFGRSLIDGFAFLYVRNHGFTFSYDGEEYIHEALVQKRGLILISAHVGNMEIAGNLLSKRIRSPINFLMLDEEREEIKRVFADAIANRQFKTIPVSQDPLNTMIKVQKALSANEIVCVAADRISGSEEFREIEFLGAKARFPVGPFLFGAITRAPVIAVFTAKIAPSRFLLKVYSQYDFAHVNRENRNQEMLQAMTSWVEHLENFVRQYPDQWFNMYDFWKW